MIDFPPPQDDGTAIGHTRLSPMRGALVAIVIVTAGVYALRHPKLEYLATSTIGIQAQRSGDSTLDPVAAVELMKRSGIADTVVRQLVLYVTPENSADSPFLTDLRVKDQFMPATYEVTLDDSSKRWLLAVHWRDVADSGVVGDSVGTKFGLNWRPEPATLTKFAAHGVTFHVTTPREASADLMTRLTVAHGSSTGRLLFSLADLDPRRAARSLNEILRMYVAAARRLNNTSMSIVDSAATPQTAFKNTPLQRFGVAIAAGVAVAVATALTLVALGGRWRGLRPDQA